MTKNRNGMMEVGTPVLVDIYEWQWTGKTYEQILIKESIQMFIPEPRRFKDSGITFPCGSSTTVDYNGRSYQLHTEGKGKYSIVKRAWE